MRKRQLVKTQTPVLDYNNTGEWDNPEEIETCKNCFNNQGKYGEDTFYCEGNLCTSEYEPKGTCSLNSLVAKSLEQCEKPVYQKGQAPRRISGKNSEGCKNDSDCGGEDNICVIKNVIGENGKLYKNKGVCQGKIKEKYNSKEKDLNKNYKKIDMYPNLNLINLLNDITTSNTFKITLNEIHNLTCRDIKDLIKLKVIESKKNNTYDIERNKVIESLKHINENPKIKNNTFNLIETAIENINCIIKEIHKEFEIENENRVKVLTKSNNLMSDDNNDNNDNNDSSIKDEKPHEISCSKNFKIGSLITIGILILIILIITYLYIKQKQFNNIK